jgi:hypothetical protein
MAADTIPNTLQLGSGFVGANRSARRLLLVALPFVLLLSACGSAADATPTLSVESIATNAYMTFSAEMATKEALTPPTDTPAPSLTPLPTLPAVSALPTFAFASSTPLVGGTSNCDDAVYAADVTIPDGTIMQPGEGFVKTWRFLNSGTCAWSTTYKLVFVSGNSMGATSAPVPLAVPVNNQGDISVTLKAPGDSGTYKGNWQLQNDKNQPFGSIVYVQIQVGASGSAACSSTSSGNVNISGNVGRPDVDVNYSGTKGGSGVAIADGNGNYVITVPSGWSGSITPTKGSYVFDPPSLSFPNVNCNVSGQDFEVH